VAIGIMVFGGEKGGEGEGKLSENETGAVSRGKNELIH
jgi:hypothetical protein